MGTTKKPMTQLRLAVFALAAMMVLSGCILLGDPVPPGIRNLTDETVEVYLIGYEDDGTDRFLFGIPASDDRAIPPEFDCSSPMEARTSDGVVVDRRDEPLCPDDVWEIDSNS